MQNPDSTPISLTQVHYTAWSLSYIDPLKPLKSFHLILRMSIRSWLYVVSDKEILSMPLLFFLKKKIKVFLNKARSPSETLSPNSRRVYSRNSKFSQTRTAFSLLCLYNNQNIGIYIKISDLYIIWLVFNSQSTCSLVTIQVQNFFPNYISDIQRNTGHVTSYLVLVSLPINNWCWSDDYTVYV